MMSILIFWTRRILNILRLFIDKVALQCRIIGSLEQLEFRIRAEKGAFGVFGVLLEPLMLMLTLLALRIFIRQTSSVLINPMIWLVCGLLTLYLFKKIGIKALGGVKKGQSLFFYKRIRPIDTLLASTWLETRIHGSMLVIVFAAEAAYFWRIKLDDPSLALITFTLTVVLALGVGTSALVVGHKIPIVKTLVRFGINRILLWTSGIFFATYTLPAPVRPYVTWNPLLHAVELMRHSINLEYPIPSISLAYLSICTFSSIGFGLLFYFNNETLLLSDE